MKYPPMIGIYLIENTASGKVYVGQAGGKEGIEGRWKSEKTYLSSLKPNKRIQNKHLQSSWDKHGEEAFDFVVLEIPFIDYNPFTDLSFNRQMGFELTRREQYWKDTLQNAGYILYNQKGPVNTPMRGVSPSDETRLKLSVAHSGKNHPNFGKPRAESTKEKISASLKGRPGHLVSDETKNKISTSKKGAKHPYFGKHLAEDHRKKISNSNKGKKVSDETKAKIGAANKGKSTWIKGKKHSDETKAKISASSKGKIFSEEHKANMAKSKTGFVHSEESKLKISAANKGKHSGENHHFYGKSLSDTHKSNISKALKGTRGGENTATSILTWEIVELIRQGNDGTTEYKRKMGAKYGVSPSTIHDLLLNKTWKK